MPSVVEVLRDYGYASSEQQVAEALTVLLRPHQKDVGVGLAAADEQFLREHAGISPASPAALAGLDARSVALAASEAAGTLTRGQVAQLLGVDPTRVSHLAAAGSLYCYPLSRVRQVYPDWQFTDGRILPNLHEVLAALPAGTHPLTVRTFMTTPDDSLHRAGQLLSPRQWLLGHGPAAAVLALVGTLGEQE